jgi:histidine triad (HIT) family protein
MTTLFEKIIAGEIPCDKVFENERILAFNDIAPQAPVHILIIPKKPIENIAAVTPEDQALLGEILLIAKEIAKEHNLESFRLITNSGRQSGQEVFHLHFHLLGGRHLGSLG